MISRHHKYAPTQQGQPRQSLYGKADTRKGGGIEHADKFGTNLVMRSAEPPPIAEYDEWLKRRNQRFCATNHGTQKTGYRLRRIVVMRRNGASWKECAEATGITAQTARNWVEMLPMGMGA